MARKERSGDKLMDKGLTDRRYNNPQDARIQKKRLDEALRKLRGQAQIVKGLGDGAESTA